MSCTNISSSSSSSNCSSSSRVWLCGFVSQDGALRRAVHTPHLVHPFDSEGDEERANMAAAIAAAAAGETGDTSYSSRWRDRDRTVSLRQSSL